MIGHSVSVVTSCLRVHLPEWEWWIDLPELTSIQLGTDSISFTRDEDSRELVMRSIPSFIPYWLDLPKLTTLTTTEWSSTFHKITQLTLESDNPTKQSQLDLPSLTDIALSHGTFRKVSTLHTLSCFFPSSSSSDISPALEDLLSSSDSSDSISTPVCYYYNSSSDTSSTPTCLRISSSSVEE